MFYPRVQPSKNAIKKNAINEEKMDTIIDAILQGKYSIACLILLEATGYNPLQYMPYRTYKRLQKQRQQAVVASNSPKIATTSRSSVNALRKNMADLDYVEPLPGKASSHKTGGNSHRRTFSPWGKMPHFLTISKFSEASRFLLQDTNT